MIVSPSIRPNQQQDMAITYVIKFDVKPDKRDAFLALLTGLLDAMRHEAMFRQAVLHPDPECEHRFMLYKTWESQEHVLNVQLKRAYRDEWHAALPELLRKPRDSSIWKPIRADKNTHRTRREALCESGEPR